MTNWNSSAATLDQDTIGIVQNDRRRNVRTAPVGDTTALWVEADHRIPVEVVDESPEGLGVIIPPNSSFEIGPVVYLDYQGVRRTGRVAHLTSRDDNSFRLGLAWD